MISSKEFIHHVERGRDVCVRRSGAQRIIRFSDRRGKSYGEITIDLEDYDRLMLEVAEGLVGGHGKKFHVAIKRNYYGGMGAEVRSCFIFPSVSRLAISPPHLIVLSHKLSEKCGGAAHAN